MRPIDALITAIYELQNMGRLSEDTVKKLEDIKSAEYYEHPLMIEALKNMYKDSS